MYVALCCVNSNFRENDDKKRGKKPPRDKELKEMVAIETFQVHKDHERVTPFTQHLFYLINQTKLKVETVNFVYSNMLLARDQKEIMSQLL
jgi:hypothetical protein